MIDFTRILLFSLQGVLITSYQNIRHRLSGACANSILAIMNAERYQLLTIPWNPVFFDRL
ncbi:hypothetical protein P692DRAFT_20317324 [Suillus brevipes Sb2]|nr:hypothetical protein P692DRAFT_20317324 [Suillus brevipes Sb2]